MNEKWLDSNQFPLVLTNWCWCCCVVFSKNFYFFLIFAIYFNKCNCHLQAFVLQILYGLQTLKHQWAAALFTNFFSFSWAASAEISLPSIQYWIRPELAFKSPLNFLEAIYWFCDTSDTILQGDNWIGPTKLDIFSYGNPVTFMLTHAGSRYYLA